jgi:hypothetical protein
MIRKSTSLPATPLVPVSFDVVNQFQTVYSDEYISTQPPPTLSTPTQPPSAPLRAFKLARRETSLVQATQAPTHASSTSGSPAAVPPTAGVLLLLDFNTVYSAEYTTSAPHPNTVPTLPVILPSPTMSTLLSISPTATSSTAAAVAPPDTPPENRLQWQARMIREHEREVALATKGRPGGTSKPWRR